MRQAFGVTDVGQKRTRNEDFIFIKNEAHGPLRNIFVLADGMGGHNAGHIASESACEYFCEYLESKDIGFIYIEDLLADALRDTNTKVHRKAGEHKEYSGMGTTLTACAYDDKNLYYAHVGDSRLYVLLNDGSLRQITKDHSLVNSLLEDGVITEEEARTHPRRNVVTRAVGTDYAVEVDKSYYELKNVAKIMLCSDGLTDMLTDNEIVNIMNSKSGNEEIAQKLVDAANEAGGLDNISVVLIW